MIGDRKQEKGDRRQKTEDRRQETGDRRQETEKRGQEIGEGDRGTEVRGYETGDTGIEDSKKEIGNNVQETGDSGRG